MSIRSIESMDGALKILEEYLYKFVHEHIISGSRPEVSLINKIQYKNYCKNSASINLYEDQNLIIELVGLKNGL